MAKAVPLTDKRKAQADAAGGKIFYGKPLTDPVVVQMRYQHTLEALIKQMLDATEATQLRIWRDHRPAVESGQDAPSMASQARILTNALAKRFIALFNKLAPEIAGRFVHGVNTHSASNLKGSLKTVSGGFTLKTDVINGKVADILKASVAENVALIKSIPQQYFKDIQGAIMRGITQGEGSKTVFDKVTHTGAVTDRRAELIARDQTSKTTSALNGARMEQLGIKQFEWLHSGGGNEPRPLHLNELDGNIYSLDDPPVIDEKTGVRGLPGYLINCGCRMRPVIKFGS